MSVKLFFTKTLKQKNYSVLKCMKWHHHRQSLKKKKVLRHDRDDLRSDLQCCTDSKAVALVLPRSAETWINA